jgi:hypothetical protein
MTVVVETYCHRITAEGVVTAVVNPQSASPPAPSPRSLSPAGGTGVGDALDAVPYECPRDAGYLHIKHPIYMQITIDYVQRSREF